jgi:hypothetical protein
MSFDEMSSLLKAHQRQLYEEARVFGFFNGLIQGVKIKSPSDICTFEWEKQAKGRRKYTKEQVDKNTKEAEKWLNNRLV